MDLVRDVSDCDEAAASSLAGLLSEPVVTDAVSANSIILATSTSSSLLRRL